MSDDIEDFLEEVDWVSNEVQAIISGKTNIEKSEKLEAQRKKLKDDEEKKKLEGISKGREGKGIKFDLFKHYCKYCSREFTIETPKCTICNRDTVTSQERKEDLMAKVEEYKKEKAIKAENKLRWENWKKTESILYKKNSTNYKKWMYFEDDEEQEPETDFIPPENDPNFAALEKDMKERAEKRKKDLEAARVLKEKGNEYYKQGKYRNAIVKYEEASQIKKDMMVLYTNSAAARLKIDDFEGAIKDCSRVIEYYEVFEKEFEANKDTVYKARYRRGDAYRGLKQYCEAVIDYEKSLEIKQDNYIENLLERCREEAADLSVSTLTEEIQNSEDIISNLDTKEKIQSFRVTGGYQILFKRVYESMDLNALKVLEFLMKDETVFINLQPLVLPLYDKRQTAAVMMMEALKKYRENHEFCNRLCSLLSLSIENLHVREEIAKHSATTKGKKFYRQALEIFIEGTFCVKSLVPMLSNLCLTVHKTAFERKPNPGNMKSLIRYSWSSFVKAYKGVLLSSTTEALGLLCNLSVDPKVKKLFLDEKEIVLIAIGICLEGTKSLDVERTSGFLINILSSPTELEKLEGYYESIWTCCVRLFNIEPFLDVLEERALKIMFRIFINKPEFVNKLIEVSSIVKHIIGKIDSNNSDTIVKILAASTGSKNFCEMIDLDVLANELNRFISRLRSGEKIDEKVANLCLSIGRIAGNIPSSTEKFSSCIPGLVDVIKEKTGPVRKNIAICLGKLCNNEKNKEIMRDVHGLEVLNSIIEHINKI